MHYVNLGVSFLVLKALFNNLSNFEAKTLH